MIISTMKKFEFRSIDLTWFYFDTSFFRESTEYITVDFILNY